MQDNKISCIRNLQHNAGHKYRKEKKRKEKISPYYPPSKKGNEVVFFGRLEKNIFQVKKKNAAWIKKNASRTYPKCKSHFRKSKSHIGKCKSHFFHIHSKPSLPMHFRLHPPLSTGYQTSNLADCFFLITFAAENE